MMKTRTGIARVLAVILVLTLALTLIPITASASSSSDVTFTFTDSGITASGSSDNYEIDGTTLTISGAGTYTVTGSCSEGSVVVKKETTGVTLILKDLTLSASATAPVVLKKSTEVTIDVEGTVTLTDNEDPANEDSSDEKVADAFEGAAIKVKDGGSLILSGDGTLNVNADSCKNGIKGGATATITVKSGTYNIKAAKNGLASDGEVIITGGTINVTADNDAIKAAPDEDDTESKGDVTITGGTITINAGDDGIKAAYDLVIGTEGSDGPTINIQKSNEGIEGATITLNSGNGTIIASDDGINAANSDLTNYTYLLTINGGTWFVNGDGDGIDSNGNLVNNGGEVTVYGAANSGNAALDIGDMGCTWSSNGGSILAIGMNGMAVVPNSGTYVAFGYNGMGGGMGGNPGDMGGQAPGNMGGMTPPSGNTTMTTMATMTNTTSSGTVSITKGSTITIKDSSGNTVAEATGMKNANCVIYTGDDLTSGETYTLYVNDTAVATATATTGNGQSSGGQTPPDGNGGQTPPDANGGNEPANNYPENSTPFTDVGTQKWWSQAINEAYSSGIMAGTSSTTFSPNMELTRGMLVQMLYALEGKPAVTTKTTFSDVSSDAYYYDAMGWAQNNGIIAGYNNGTVGPTDKLTREQAVVILNAYAKYKNVSTGNSKAITSFNDASNVSSWASSAVQWAYGNGLLGGFEDNTLRPQSTTTRAQMAQIMMQFMKLIK